MKHKICAWKNTAALWNNYITWQLGKSLSLLNLMKQVFYILKEYNILKIFVTFNWKGQYFINKMFISCFNKCHHVL